MPSEFVNRNSFFIPWESGENAKALISLTQLSQCLQSVMTKNSDSSTGTAQSKSPFQYTHVPHFQ